MYKQTESKSACPRCVRNGRDSSGDNLHNYGEGRGSYCWSCGYTILSDDKKEELGIEVEDEIEKEYYMSTKEKIDKETTERIKSETGIKGHNLRGITDATYKVFSVRHKYDEETGEPIEQFYPVTEDYEMSGFKVRILPKDFKSIGKVGKESDLFGQFKFKSARGKFVVLTSGEVDCMSAYQMLEDYRKSKNSDFEPIPCVSSLIGESGSYKQIQKHYEYFNKFERIILAPDMDDAGQEAIHKIAKVLPKGKVYVMDLPMKDVNEMLEAGKEKQFIDCFFKAKQYTPNGIVASSDLLGKMIEGAGTPRISLPPFMHKLEGMMAGGWPLKTILTLSSASGTGKSSILEAMMLHWIFNAPYKVGIISLESDAAQFSTKLLSAYIKHKIDLIPTQEERIEFLQQEWVQGKAKELFELADGSPRFYLIEDRDGGIDSVKDLVSQMVSSLDVQIIIIDPWSDLGEASTLEEQAAMMKWLKGMVKSHDVSFALVCHVRKSSNSQKANSTGADLHEEDIFGSGSVMKSSACNLLFSRNKEAEDEVERNTIYMKASKIRWTGNTGVAGVYYYDNQTATLHDKEEYFTKRGGEF